MKINGYHHVALFSQDMEKSLKLYLGLGGKIVHSFGTPERTINLVDLGGNAVLEIIPDGKGVPEVDPHLPHICLRTDDVDEAFATAIKFGATPKSEPTDHNLNGMEARNAFVFGPDNEQVEFFCVK